MPKLTAQRVVQRFAEKQAALPPEFLEQQKKMKDKAKGKEDDKDKGKEDDKKDDKKEKGKGKVPPQFLEQQKKNKKADQE